MSKLLEILYEGDSAEEKRDAIKMLIYELIGEDDNTGLEQSDSKFWAHTGRNDLREELCQKVADL